jgi:hypothetical protein
MNERNLREYVVRYRRNKYIRNTKFTQIQKVRALMHTNTTALEINKEADRIRIRDTSQALVFQYLSSNPSALRHKRSCFSTYARSRRSLRFVVRFRARTGARVSLHTLQSFASIKVCGSISALRNALVIRCKRSNPSLT